MKLFAIKLSLEIFVLYLKHFNNIANNTTERKNLRKFFFFFCKSNKYIPYADYVENDYIIYIYIYTHILYTGKSLVKKMQATRERAQ